MTTYQEIFSYCNKPDVWSIFGIKIRECYGICTTSGYCEWDIAFLITLFGTIDVLLLFLNLYLRKKR
jgi:hypothetical protein